MAAWVGFWSLQQIRTQLRAQKPDTVNDQGFCCASMLCICRERVPCTAVVVPWRPSPARTMLAAVHAVAVHHAAACLTAGCVCICLRQPSVHHSCRGARKGSIGSYSSSSNSSKNNNQHAHIGRFAQVQAYKPAAAWLRANMDSTGQFTAVVWQPQFACKAGTQHTISLPHSLALT